MKILLALLLITGYTNAALANGYDKGNGGYTIACDNAGVITYKTLDLFEAESLGRKLFTYQTQDPYQIAQETIERLRNLSPRRFKTYQNLLEQFKFKSIFLGKTDFQDVHDTGNASTLHLPANCKITPTAIQKRQVPDGETQFFINNDIWSQLSNIDRAALILHEIVYMEFQHENSLLSRFFVGLLMSNEFEKYKSTENFFELLKYVEAPFAEFENFEIDLKQPYEFEDGKLSIAWVKEGLYKFAKNNIYYTSHRIQFYTNGIPKYLYIEEPLGSNNLYPLPCLGTVQLAGGVVMFHANGNLQSAGFNANEEGFSNTCPGSIFRNDPKNSLSRRFELYDNGDLLRILGVELEIDMPSGHFLIGDLIVFWPDQQLNSGFLLKSSSLITPRFGTLSALRARFISFHKSGQVQCFFLNGNFAFTDRLNLLTDGERYCFDTDGSLNSATP